MCSRNGGFHHLPGARRSNMAVEIKSKKGVVSKAPYELYMTFVDMRNFVQFLPEDKKEGVTADFDTIHAQVKMVGCKMVLEKPTSTPAQAMAKLPQV